MTLVLTEVEPFMSKDCIFCKIIAGEMKTEFIYKDEMAVSFDDIHPLAPVHSLIVPVEHIGSLTEANHDMENLLGHLLRVCNEVAKKKGVAEKGYRVVINVGPEGGQIVPHLHMHVLGGRKMKDDVA